MNFLDCLVLGALAVAIVYIVIFIVRRKKQYKSGCGSCPYYDNCRVPSGRVSTNVALNDAGTSKPQKHEAHPE